MASSVKAYRRGRGLWSKAGWMSQARHDAAYVEIDGHHPFILVVFSEGAARATDHTLLPELAPPAGPGLPAP